MISVYYSNILPDQKYYVTVVYIYIYIAEPSAPPPSFPHQTPYKRVPICNYIWTPLSTAEIYYCDAIEQTSIARYLLCVDCLRVAGHRLSQQVHKSSQRDRAKNQSSPEPSIFRPSPGRCCLWLSYPSSFFPCLFTSFFLYTYNFFVLCLRC